MVNERLILARIDEVRRALKRLKKLAALSKENFLADDDHFAVAEHHLRRALEALLDAGRHIIAKEGLAKPADYTEIITLLGKHGIIPQEFAQKIRGISGYRNRLVHLYAEVTREEIYELITLRLNDLNDFIKYLLEFLKK